MSIFGYTSYSPPKAQLYWLQCAQEILAEYRDELPLTVRQIFYRLVASYDYAKTEAAYGKLAAMMTRARRASMLSREDRGTTPLIPFHAIRDDKLRARQGHFYDGVEEFQTSIVESADYYELDRQQGQPQHIEMWCEAQGMLPVLASIADPYSIRVSSSGGYDSITTKHNLARRVSERYEEGDMNTLLLHVGDFDGSGEDMFSNLRNDVGKMVRQLTGSRAAFECQRVALTAEQVIERDVITAPPKPTDSRSRGFVENNWQVVDHLGHEDISAQLEALTPTDLRELFTEVIEGHLDTEVYQARLADEERQRTALVSMLRDLDLSI